MPSLLPVLPHDLLVRIASHLDPLNRHDLDRLRRLCLVSKAWLRAAQPRFWSFIAIYDLRQWPIPKPEAYCRTHDDVHRRKKDREVVDKAVEERRKLLKQHGYSADEMVEDIRRFQSDLFDPEEYDTDDWSHDWSASDIVNSSTHHQLTTLEEKPHLAQLVRRFVFFGQYEGRAAALAIRRALAVCPHVEGVELAYPTPAHWPGVSRVLRRGKAADEAADEERWKASPPFLADGALRSPTTLRSLTLTNFLLANFNTLVLSLSTFPHLEYLSLSCNDDRHDHEWQPYTSNNPLIPFPPPLYRLKNLDVGGVIPQDAFDALASPHSDTLTSLTVAIRRHPLVLGPRFTRLDHLALVFGQPIAVKRTLRTAPPSVRHLELKWWRYMGFYGAGIDFYRDTIEDETLWDFDYYDMEPEESLSESILEAIPETITRLSFPYFFHVEEGPTKDWDLLLGTLKERTKRGKNGVPTWLPSLKILDVADYTRKSEIEEEAYNRVAGLMQGREVQKRLAEGKTATPVPMSQKRARSKRKKLQEECDKRGVWLSPLWQQWIHYREIYEEPEMRVQEVKSSWQKEREEREKEMEKREKEIEEQEKA